MLFADFPQAFIAPEVMCWCYEFLLESRSTDLPTQTTATTITRINSYRFAFRSNHLIPSLLGCATNSPSSDPGHTRRDFRTSLRSMHPSVSLLGYLATTDLGHDKHTGSQGPPFGSDSRSASAEVRLRASKLGSPHNSRELITPLSY